MAETSLPWAGLISEGAVGDAGGYSDTAFATLFHALMENRTGVIDGLVVKAASPAGAKVVVTAGKALIWGRLYVLDADTELTISANTSGNNRIDRVVLVANYTAQTIRLSVKAGTPAGTPVAPSLTQSAGVTWELSLSTVDADNGFSSIVEADIHRDRIWARETAPGDTKFSMNPNLEGSVWLKCDGRAISRTTYVDLFDAIGTTHGVGDGSTTFNLPDMRGRVPGGMDNMGTAAGSANVVTATEADSVGGEVGAENHTLTTAEIPPLPIRVYNTNGVGLTYPGGVASGGSAASLAGYVNYGVTPTPVDLKQPTIFGYQYIRL